MISFKWRHFQKEIILLLVRWYLSYSLSYRDLEEMMLERGINVDHSTINRWVIHYSPLLEDEFRKNHKRQIKYLNNIVEQDHRGIKRIINPASGIDLRSLRYTV